MSSIKLTHATTALAALHIQADETRQEVEKQPTEPPLPSSDDELDSSLPILVKFLEAKGPSNSLKRTDFTSRELGLFYARFAKYICSN